MCISVCWYVCVYSENAMLLICRPTSYTSHVIMEILTTERTYVVDLSDIVEVCIFILVYLYVKLCLCFGN